MESSILKVSIIIPTYKDLVALKLILDALQYQTYKNFEAIIAEDDDAQETKDFLLNYKSSFPIKHFYQEDDGNRKPRAVNNGIKISDGEYIIFIDGDTIPFSTFVENHVALSSPKIGLCGRRVNLGDKVSQDLRDAKIAAYQIEKSFFTKYFYLKNDNIRHYEQGITFNPNSLFYRILSSLNKNAHILASNFSCYKNVLLEVNGIDEGLPFAPSRDDYDLQWRLERIEVKMKSCKYCANLLHLNHLRTERIQEDKHNKILIEIKKQNNEFKAKDGIYKL